MKENAFQRSLRFLILAFVALSINRYIEFSYAADSEAYPFKHFLKFEIVQLIFAILISLPFLFLRKSYRIYKLILIPLWIYLGIEFMHVIMFHGFPNSATYFTVFSSNSLESVEFINDYFGFGMFLYLLIFIITLVLFSFLMRNLLRQHESFAKFSYISLVLFGFAVYMFTANSNRLNPISLKDISVVKSITSYSTYLQEKEKFNQIANQKIEFDHVERKTSHNEIETHVIVIGESTSKHHMSLYNYARNTNPKLSKQEITIFDHAKSPNAHTVPALEKVLTFKNKTRPSLGIEDGSIIDMANQTGYETFWISNQAFSGEHETSISVIASKADHKIYTNATGGTYTLDEALIEPYKKALSSKKSKVIFVHLMGTHLSYKNRYSSKYAVFKDDYNIANMKWDKTQQNFINQYDNAILYNDFVVNELITELEKTNTIATFTYFSDHGDEVYDFRNFHGHSDVMLSKYMYDVPLLLWFSESYKLKQAEQLTLLIQSGKAVFSTENLIHLWSDFLDTYTEHYQSDLSPVTFEYKSNEPIVNLPIITHPTKNNLSFNSKIWCHRVNGITRLKEAKEHFSGFEIDVVFHKEGWFDVNHPPAESIELKLSQLIKSTSQPSKYNYWLDMKNLDMNNSLKAAAQLLSLSKEMNCTENIVVESSCIECLPFFDSLGFNTSYYLPFLHQMNEMELAESLIKIEKELTKFSPSVLSQERDSYALIKKHFPNCNFISWDLQTEVTDDESLSSCLKWVSSETQLKVLLVRYDSGGWR